MEILKEKSDAPTAETREDGPTVFSPDELDAFADRAVCSCRIELVALMLSIVSTARTECNRVVNLAITWDDGTTFILPRPEPVPGGGDKMNPYTHDPEIAAALSEAAKFMAARASAKRTLQ